MSTQYKKEELIIENHALSYEHITYHNVKEIWPVQNKENSCSQTMKMNTKFKIHHSSRGRGIT